MKRFTSVALAVAMIAAGTTACTSEKKAACEEYVCVSEAVYSQCDKSVAKMTVTISTPRAEALYEIIVTQDDQLPKYAASRLPTKTGEKFRSEHVAARQYAKVEIVAQDVLYTRTFDRQKDCKTSA